MFWKYRGQINYFFYNYVIKIMLTLCYNYVANNGQNRAWRGIKKLKYYIKKAFSNILLWFVISRSGVQIPLPAQKENPVEIRLYRVFCWTNFYARIFYLKTDQPFFISETFPSLSIDALISSETFLILIPSESGFSSVLLNLFLYTCVNSAPKNKIIPE